MQFGLDLPYPPLGLALCGPFQRWRVGIHRRPPGLPASSLPACWLPSPCGRLSRPPTTTKPPPHPAAINRRRICPPLPWPGSGEGDPGWFPRSPRTDRRGRCPAIPRPPRHEYAAAFPRGLLTGLNIPAAESPATCSDGRARHTDPDPPGSSRLDAYGTSRAGSSRTPSRLACRTRAVWQCRRAPSLSGLLPTLPGVSRIRLSSASTGLLRQPSGKGLPPPLGHTGASWRTNRSSNRRPGSATAQR